MYIILIYIILYLFILEMYTRVFIPEYNQSDDKTLFLYWNYFFASWRSIILNNKFILLFALGNSLINNKQLLLDKKNSGIGSLRTLRQRRHFIKMSMKCRRFANKYRELLQVIIKELNKICLNHTRSTTLTELWKTLGLINCWAGSIN